MMKYDRPPAGKPCLDCKSLLSGTRSLQTPHAYLVPAAQPEQGSSAKSYSCLICKTTLTHEAGSPPSWR